MTRRFRLATVLRARHAQEDAAKGAVLRARAVAQTTADRHARRERELTDLPTLNGGPAAWYMAALAARQAQAGELTAAAGLAAADAEQVQQAATDLAGTAVRRRSVETLADRHAAAAQQAELEAGQRAIDELAATRRPTGRTTL
jgi:flagellar FliJ protein